MVLHPQGLLDALWLCAILVKKLLSWLLLVNGVCEIICHYLLLIIDWVVRYMEKYQVTGECVQPKSPADTGIIAVQGVVRVTFVTGIKIKSRN